MNQQLMQHGMFSWNELVTPDVNAAKAFYSKLLGWTLEDLHPQGMPYTLIKTKQQEIGGIMATPGEASDMPPTWGSYVTVEDVDSLVKRVVELGGQIVVPPRDIPKVGRFTVIQDPQGALLNLISYTPCK